VLRYLQTCLQSSILDVSPSGNAFGLTCRANAALENDACRCLSPCRDTTAAPKGFYAVRGLQTSLQTRILACSFAFKTADWHADMSAIPQHARSMQRMVRAVSRGGLLRAGWKTCLQTLSLTGRLADRRLLLPSGAWREHCLQASQRVCRGSRLRNVPV
jgi:hypothetical protein